MMSYNRGSKAAKDCQVCVCVCVYVQAIGPQVPPEDAQYVYEMLNDDFAQTWKEWTDAQPQDKIQLSLPSLVDPLKRLSQTAVIIFFLGKLPFANDVAQGQGPA